MGVHSEKWAAKKFSLIKAYIKSCMAFSSKYA
jgi:hypothetical protein